MKTAASAAQFASTLWSVVLTAGRGSEVSARDALEQLCQTYWYPLYAFLRRQGRDPHDAQDLTQGFFAWFLANDQLGGADPEQGRFRSFLLCRLKGYVNDELKRSRAEKRGGGRIPISLDAEVAEERYKLEPANDLSADKIFERRWALMVLETTVQRLRDEYDASGRGQLFEELKTFRGGADAEGSYAEAARRVSMTESAVKSAIWRLRQRHRQLLRDEIAKTVSDAAELEAEIRYLISVVGG